MNKIKINFRKDTLEYFVSHKDNLNLENGRLQ